MRGRILTTCLIGLTSAWGDARAFEATYRLDPGRSFVRECRDDVCENVPVSGRVELSMEGESARLEILHFRGDVDEFTRRVWSGTYMGTVGARLGEESTLVFPVEGDVGPLAQIDARVSGDSVSFSGLEYRDGPLVTYAMVGIARSRELEASAPLLLVDRVQPRRLRMEGPVAPDSRLHGFHLSVYTGGLVEYSVHRELPGPRAPVEQVDIVYLAGEEIDALRRALSDAGASGLSGPQASSGDLETSTRVSLFWTPRSSRRLLLANHFSYFGQPVASEVRAVEEVIEAFIAEHFPLRIVRF